MENNHKNNPHKRQVQDKQLVVKYIVTQVEIGAGLSLSELKKQYSEETFIAVALTHITTTKTATCTALNMPVEAGCRYKRSLEKEGLLMQSIDEVVCPFTKHSAHLISTNPKEFERLQKSKSNQLKMFDL